MRLGKYFEFCEKRGLLPVIWEEEVWLQWDGMNGPFHLYGRKSVAGVWVDDVAVALGDGQHLSKHPDLGLALQRAADRIERLEGRASKAALMEALREVAE